MGPRAVCKVNVGDAVCSCGLQAVDVANKHRRLRREYESKRNYEFFIQQRTNMTNRATGTFEVKLTPQVPDENAGDANIGRMLIDKQFHGDLEATSKGQMLAVGTEVKGSAG